MIKTLAAAAAALLIAAPASAAVRTIDFTITPRDYGWERLVGSDLAYGIGEAEALTGQIKFDDAAPTFLINVDGIWIQSLEFVEVNFTAGSRSFLVDEISAGSFVSIADGKLQMLRARFGGNNGVDVVGGYTNGIFDDGTNRTYCTGCVTYVESMDGQVISEGGPGSQGSAVPEPATWAMMISGFGLAGAVMRRRRTALAC